MINYDLTMKQYVLKSKLSAELSLFHADGSNLIKTVFGPRGPKNVIIVTFSDWGAEIAVNYRLSEQFLFNTNYPLLSMEEPIIAAPEKTFYTGGTYTNLSLIHI